MERLNKILIDTNVLIYMYENKKDIFEECRLVITDPEFYVLDKVFQELEKVYKDKPNKLLLINRYLKKLKDAKKFKILDVDEKILALSPKYKKVDNLLIYYSNKYIIYTNDKNLKTKIRYKNRVLTLRSKGVLLV